MRSRNMSAIIIVQNLIQLKRKFPKFDMDKDLIGNCSIIDILGAPDMDSCEYLSKHFGTQTIHKASDSDAKDYKGQSSRSEDVMQKSLLSAEDIFAMSKDGECAIVIKGTDPLYEPKCKMEVTPFLKLLCKKNKPYDPKRRRAEREKEKTMEPFFYVGEDAIKKSEVLREKGTHIVSLSMNDIENMVIAGKLRETTTTLKMTEDMQETLHENHERYLEEHCDLPELDYEQYRDEGPYSEESQRKFQNRCLVVTELDSAGYTRQQIKMLYKLIMKDLEADKIQKILPPSAEMEKIKKLIKNF